MLGRSAEHAATRQAALLHGRAGERGKSDDIAGGVNVRHVGLVAVVYFDLAARIGLQSRRFQPKQVAICLAANGVEQHVALHFFPALEFGEHAVAFLVNADARDFLAKAECGSHLAQVIGESVHDFAIHEIEDQRALVDQGYFSADGGHERGVLEAHDARAHHDDFARQTADASELVRINDAFAVEGNIGAASGARAASDQDIFAAQCDFFAFAMNLDRVRINKLRHSLKDRDAVAPQLRADYVRLARNDARDARSEVLNRDISLASIGASIEGSDGNSSQLKNGLTDALAGNRAGVDAHAAHHERAVHHRHALAQLRGADRALLARRATADDNQIVRLVGHG